MATYELHSAGWDMQISYWHRVSPCTLTPAYDASHFLVFIGLPSAWSPIKCGHQSWHFAGFLVKKRPAGTRNLRPFLRHQQVTDYLLPEPHLLTRPAKFPVGPWHLLRMKCHQIPRERQLKPPDYSMHNAYSLSYCLRIPMLTPAQASPLSGTKFTESCAYHSLDGTTV